MSGERWAALCGEHRTMNGSVCSPYLVAVGVSNGFVNVINTRSSIM